MTPKDMATWAAVAIQASASLLWFYATIAKVTAKKVEEEYQKLHGPDAGPFQIQSEDGSDVIATLELQTKLNRWAAFATGVGVAAMAIATLLPSQET